ncbi:Ppx/GppA family phosphatase [Rhizobium sp. KAs_5_22]|uniref:Ppx/GppA phosphatase family protein n=1 Tax=Ciceribacter selenitireducens TaxID=448181 RepID=UPI00048EC440|nr:Ppx/GppA phosphatase family protein [Ciceribacter selenitireducens]PPJ47692.1 Ppx/GppA family phosphatase [Rhizobium sp. KAs_5_22]
MTDPDRGSKPSSEGASTGKRKGGGSRRRGKARKGAPKTSGVADSALEAVAAQPHASRRPDIEEAEGPVRKRKRRRRSRSTQAPSVSPEIASPTLRLQPDAAAPAATPGDAKPGKKRRRNRGGRGPQGRPLAPAAPSQAARSATAPAPVPSGHNTHHAQGPRRGPAANDRFRAPPGAEPWPDDLYAALDLGTNNCRLLIAQPTRPGQFRVVDAFSRIVRLGEGLGTQGRLSAEAMDRAVEALKVCAAKLSGRDIRRMRLIATEACRAADNGEEFLSRVLVETGLELEIINRETEARLAVSGCSSLVGREARSVVLFDIGGGSSEIAVISIGENRSSRLANHITHWTSLPVGVVTLSERHGGQHVTPEIFEAMTQEVEGMLARFDCPPLTDLSGRPPEDFHLIGTSGTVTTLAGVHLDLPRYDRRKVDGLWLSDAEVSAMQAKLLSWDFAGRAANPCIGPDRADLVLAGCAILEAIRRRWPSNRMRVADRGLREGLLTDMMADDGVWRRGRRRPSHDRER